jgi:CRP-like cAMP-binding protein
MRQLSIRSSTADQIRVLGTTILYMPNRSEGVEQAFRNKTGLARYRDYRGAGLRDEFLSRFWYLAQRQDLHLDPSPAPDAVTRLQMLEQVGAFRRDSGTLPQLARESAFRRFRRGDLLLAVGDPATEAFLVAAGQLVVMVPTNDAEIQIEVVESGQLLVLQEMLAGGPSPVRVAADQDTDVLVIPARVLVDAMERSRVVARDIGAAAEARRQAILPLNRRLRSVA